MTRVKTEGPVLIPLVPLRVNVTYEVYYPPVKDTFDPVSEYYH